MPTHLLFPFLQRRPKDHHTTTITASATNLGYALYATAYALVTTDAPTTIADYVDLPYIITLHFVQI